MAVRLGGLYDALKAAGAGEELAARASEEVAEFKKLETRLVRVEATLYGVAAGVAAVLLKVYFG